jgi:hypothetical protein
VHARDSLVVQTTYRSGRFSPHPNNPWLGVIRARERSGSRRVGRTVTRWDACSRRTRTYHLTLGRRGPFRRPVIFQRFWAISFLTLLTVEEGGHAKRSSSHLAHPRNPVV